MDIKKQLEGEFNARLEELGAMNLGEDNYKVATDCMTKVADRIIEIEKIESDNELKARQMKEEKRDRLIKNVIEVGKFVGGTAITALAFIASINFEREGTFTTQGGRSALKELLKFKN